MERIETNGVVFYRSPLLTGAGVAHGFSTRIGGMSDGPFGSLNLGNPNGAEIQDDLGRIERNYARFGTAIGLDARERLQVHQVHGKTVAIHAGGEFDRHQQADAIVTRDPGSFASIRTADCGAVLLASDDGQVVAAVHSGWRGTVANIVGETLRAMQEWAGIEPSRVLAAIGPCIGPGRFEVGPEVVAAFRDALGPDAPVREDDRGKGWINLPAALHRQLLEAGVPAEQIDRCDLCTFEHADEFFSHRRDHGVTGRMANIIGPAR